MVFRFFRHWRDSYVGIPRAVWYLSLVNLINRCGGMVIAFLTVYMSSKLGFSIREVGYIMVFFGLGAFAGAFTGGRLTDKLGYLPVQFWSLILNGLMLISLWWVHGFWAMCAAVFTLSLVAETFRPANAVAIARHCGVETRTRSISLYRMSANIGWAIAPAAGGLLAALGWQWLFWVDGVSCIAAAFILHWTMRGRPEPEKVSPAGHPESRPHDNSPYRDKPFMAFSFFTLLGALVFMQFLWTVPVFFKQVYEWNEATIGLVAALNGIIVFTVEMPLIFKIEGSRPQLAFVRTGLILYAVAFLMLAFPPGGMTNALLYIAAISMGEIFVMPFSSNFVYSRSDGARQGQYMALYTMAYSVANILAPLFGTQIVAAWGWSTLWYFLAVLSAIAWTGFWVLQRRQESKVGSMETATTLEAREAVG